MKKELRVVYDGPINSAMDSMMRRQCNEEG